MPLYKKMLSCQSHSGYFNKCFVHKTCYVILVIHTYMSYYVMLNTTFPPSTWSKPQHVDTLSDSMQVLYWYRNFLSRVPILYKIDGLEISVTAMTIHNQKERVVCQCVNMIQNLLIKQEKCRVFSIHMFWQQLSPWDFNLTWGSD